MASVPSAAAVAVAVAAVVVVAVVLVLVLVVLLSVCLRNSLPPLTALLLLKSPVVLLLTLMSSMPVTLLKSLDSSNLLRLALLVVASLRSSFFKVPRAKVKLATLKFGTTLLVKRLSVILPVFSVSLRITTLLILILKLTN